LEYNRGEGRFRRACPFQLGQQIFLAELSEGPPRNRHFRRQGLQHRMSYQTRQMLLVVGFFWGLEEFTTVA
jgi:hypothetical protein